MDEIYVQIRFFECQKLIEYLVTLNNMSNAPAERILFSENEKHTNFVNNNRPLFTA